MSRTVKGTQIPKIIHQTWKDKNIPKQYNACVQSWLDNHSDWDYRLWTDEDNRRFVEEHYSWFMPVYEVYTQPIMLADIIRYFILDYYGGVYVDLDFLCLRPIDELLHGKSLVLGLEPSEHLRKPVIAQHSLTKLLCNAFMASPPNHPLWAFAIKRLLSTCHLPAPLEATGPVFLTETYDQFKDKTTISLEPAEYLYPIHSEQNWDEIQQDPVLYQSIKEQAYAVHLWAGSWIKPSSTQPNLANPNHVFYQDNQMIPIDFAWPLQSEPVLPSASPKISCVMVTKDRVELVKRAVGCFQYQTYLNKELVIIDDSAQDELAGWIAQLDDTRIQYHHLPCLDKTLGELRNLAIEKTTGDYIAQWDDDDLSQPERLATQMAAIIASNAVVCFLHRVQFWWPVLKTIFTSTFYRWECTMLCRKDKLPCYPAQRRGEDTAIVNILLKNNKALLLDAPDLYIYVIHGNNTFHQDHFVAHFHHHTAMLTHKEYLQTLMQLETQLQLPLLSDTISFPSISNVRSKNQEKILILTPVKDAEAHLPQYMDNILKLDYPAKQLSISFLEGDSQDNTLACLQSYQQTFSDHFAEFSYYQQNYHFHFTGPRWQPNIQFTRRSILAKSRNYLLMCALRAQHDWVLWIDVDVIFWPNDIIQQLLASKKDIVVPHCVKEPGGATFDLNTFRFSADYESLDHNLGHIDGIYYPAKGYGREYLEDLRQHSLIPIDSVGGTMLLINANLHREGLVFPTFSYNGFIETEGLAMLAKDMGYGCWGMPQLEIVHNID